MFHYTIATKRELKKVLPLHWENAYFNLTKYGELNVNVNFQILKYHLVRNADAYTYN